MDNLMKVFLGYDLENIKTFEELKKTIIDHGKRDYIFFPFLIGYVTRFLKSQTENLTLKEMTLKTIYELLKARLINVHYVNETEMTLVKWDTIEELNIVINIIKDKWDKCGDKDPEMNEVIWITAYKNSN
jgi:hypothetical protein